MICVDGGRLQRKEGKGSFWCCLPFFFFPCVKIHLSLADLVCTTVVGYSAWGVFGRCSARDCFFFPSLAACFVRKGRRRRIDLVGIQVRWEGLLL